MCSLDGFCRENLLVNNNYSFVPFVCIVTVNTVVCQFLLLTVFSTEFFVRCCSHDVTFRKFLFPSIFRFCYCGYNMCISILVNMYFSDFCVWSLIFGIYLPLEVKGGGLYKF